MKKVLAKNVEQYIAFFPLKTEKLLRQLRAIVLKNARGAEETISYGMPAYKYHGILMYFAGYEHHIGLYAMPSAVTKFQKELRGYKTSKGTVQLPLDKPLPVALITKMIRFRMKENEKKEIGKKGKKKVMK